MEPETKKAKLTEENNSSNPVEVTCKHFVKRKRRFCKMTVAKGKEYCGEHEPQTESADGAKFSDGNRIPCPLDPKHSVYKKNLRKHLKICNARPKDLPAYIVPGINGGGSSTDATEKVPKLSEVPPEELTALTDKVKELYTKYVDGKVSEMKDSHAILKGELAKEEYGFDTKKHLIQTASLLGCLEKCNLFKDSTCFVEFGAGKGHLSYWLSQVLNGSGSSKVILIDKMSHRHKKDNKIEDRKAVHRIRADIADLKMSELDLLKDSASIVAVSKHLCGVATDLTLRCILGEGMVKTEAALIALCCHHRCAWGPFVGKEFFLDNGFDQKQFGLITKMASWAICGSGFSRERRNQMDEESLIEEENVLLKQREEVGLQCKRIIDHSRLEYLRKNGFTASLHLYVGKDITLENVCILALRDKK